ncbi:uncharacterized protein LOC125227296 [Leguminivora glycinivorella]|uniref:uncharacterized protein LOC125227296 n=1 Tax=Leguminivora glycinivorella TaxID=1035111 RepID=UPI00200C3C33|nr:uncharacterized protein LOC125227296 [Leguminivora glycinivorella]
MIIRCTILLLVPLLTGASSDCDACVAGRCHRRKSLLSGFPVTDQLAIDRTDNILYLQLYGNQNIAIGLDDLQISLVNVMKTSGRAFDQKSQRRRSPCGLGEYSTTTLNLQIKSEQASSGRAHSIVGHVFAMASL